MNPLQKVIEDINRKYKTELIQVGTEMVYVDKIPFTSPRANYATYGGIPVGKATEFFGAEGGGKTTSALDIAGQAQKKSKAEWDREIGEIEQRLSTLLEKNNKSDQDLIKNLKAKKEKLEEESWRKVVYVDAENTLDIEWAQKLGVDTNDLILIRPQDQTAEQVLQMILDIIDTGQVVLLVLDSIPMLVSQNLYDESLEKKSYAGIAGALTEFSRKVSAKISKHRTALLMINQIREDLENPYNQFNTPGGKALKHLYALRLFFRKGAFFDHNNVEQPNRCENPSGNMVDMTVVKTKVFKPDRRVGQYTLKYMDGVDVVGDTVYMAVKYGFIEQSGSWFYIKDPDGQVEERNGQPLKFQGKAKLLEFLKEDPEFFDSLYQCVMEDE